MPGSCPSTTRSVRRCSTGCNISSEENRGALWRFKPRHNPLVNDYWICDEGRYSYKAANDPNLLSAMYVRQNNDLRPVAVDEALNGVDRGFKEIGQRGGIVAAVLSPFLTVEEAFLFARYVKGLNPNNVLALGPVPTRGTDHTVQPDQTKGRTGDTSFVVPRPFTIHAEKCPNQRGVSAVLEHFQGNVVAYDDLTRRIDAGEISGVYVISDAIDPWIDERAEQRDSGESRLPGGPGYDGHSAGTSGRRSPGRRDLRREGGQLCQCERASAIFRGGTCRRATAHCPTSTSWEFSSIAPGDLCLQSEILAELAETIPAFGVAKGGKLPPYGVRDRPVATADRQDGRAAELQRRLVRRPWGRSLALKT